MMTYAKNVARHTIESDVLKATDGKLDIIDFWAPWCGPCKVMEPTLEEMAKKYEYKVDIYKINLDDEPEMAKLFGIQSIPTMMFFKNGKRINILIGSMSKQRLEEEILKNI